MGTTVESYFTEGTCGYYEDRIARNHSISDTRHTLSRREITRLLAKGYRRYGIDYYRPYCRTCHECTPYRVQVQGFAASRSYRRVAKRNGDLSVAWVAPRPTQEKFELYVRYQLGRHKEGDASSLAVRKNLAAAMIRQMYMNPEDALELVVSHAGRVIAFAIFDVTDDSLSAVYSVFAPEEPERSLGTFNILCAIEKTRAMGLPFLNLGLYLEHHEKMAYKAKFTPAQVYRRFNWVQFSK